MNLLKATQQRSSTDKSWDQHSYTELPVTIRFQALIFTTKCLLGAVKLKAIACMKLPQLQLNGFGKSVLRMRGIPPEKKPNYKATKMNMGLVTAVLRKTCDEQKTRGNPSNCFTVQVAAVLPLTQTKMSSCLSIPAQASTGLEKKNKTCKLWYLCCYLSNVRNLRSIWEFPLSQCF